MGNSKSERDKIRTKDLCAEKAKIRQLKVYRLSTNENCTKNLKAETINTKSLIVDGLDVGCMLKGSGNVTISSGFDSANGTPVKPENVSQEVFDAIVQVAETQRKAFEISWANGRERLGLSEQPGVTIFGYKTLPVASAGCNESMINMVSSLNYDFEIINNELDLVQGLKLASVYIQLAYVEQSSREIVIAELQIGNRQFQPSIDSVGSDVEPFTTSAFGEKFNGTLELDNKILEEALKNMPELTNTACLQLILYIENGLDVYVPSAVETEYSHRNPLKGLSLKVTIHSSLRKYPPTYWGRVYYDCNQDGVEDPTDPGLSGAVIQAYSESPTPESVPISTSTTDADGKWVQILSTLDPVWFKVSSIQDKPVTDWVFTTPDVFEAAHVPNETVTVPSFGVYTNEPNTFCPVQQ